jgi:hypothetical protein
VLAAAWCIGVDVNESPMYIGRLLCRVIALHVLLYCSHRHIDIEKEKEVVIVNHYYASLPLTLCYYLNEAGWCINDR